jgi:hypothetical protein
MGQRCNARQRATLMRSSPIGIAFPSQPRATIARPRAPRGGSIRYSTFVCPARTFQGGATPSGAEHPRQNLRQSAVRDFSLAPFRRDQATGRVTDGRWDRRISSAPLQSCTGETGRHSASGGLGRGPADGCRSLHRVSRSAGRTRTAAAPRLATGIIRNRRTGPPSSPPATRLVRVMWLAAGLPQPTNPRRKFAGGVAGPGKDLLREGR